mmetsp:Transcript_29185/g.73702  ORF Transcript_29185/g.73702 Transcript_29185/m.73702 type:complete len:506 (-) Transcript_29185:117-1634(-)
MTPRILPHVEEVMVVMSGGELPPHGAEYLPATWPGPRVRARRLWRSSELIAVALLLALPLGGLDADLFVILLEGRQILACFRKLAFFHPFTDIPMDKGALGVHQVELVVDAREDLSDGRGIADHAARTHHLGQVASRHHCRRLVVDATLEASRAPIDELDGPLGLDGGYRGVHVLGHDVATIHHAARHVLAMARVALHEHRRGLEDAHGDLRHGQLLVVRLLGRDDGCVRRQHEVDARVGDEVRLELGDVHVERAVEAQGRCQGGDDLREEPVQISVGRPLDVQVAPANVVQGLVVIHNGHVGVLQQRVDAKHRVVGLHDRGGDLGASPDRETQLGLLAIVDREALEHQATQARAGTTSHGVVDHESLQASAIVRELADTVEHKIDDLLPDGIMAPCEVVGRILLARDQLLWVKELTVRACTHLIDHRRLEVHHDTTRHMLARTCLAEEGVERVVTSSDGLVRRHLAIWLDAMLQAEELPASVANLDARLADVDADGLTHCCSSW